MDVSAGGLFSWRYLDEFDKQISELHRCVGLARQQSADAIDHAVELLLDAADAHEQAAAAYELTGSTGPAAGRQARAIRHRQAAARRPPRRPWHLVYRTNGTATISGFKPSFRIEVRWTFRARSSNRSRPAADRRA
ncbi:MAG TPA: hypothetical protein VEF71_01010 [Streptosporangiaceae bacterium]|nr:hypothetical protein [Streptosporangiaceae bacterium]